MNTQARDMDEIMIKLDMLIIAANKAKNEVTELENLSKLELAELHNAIKQEAKYE